MLTHKGTTARNAVFTCLYQAEYPLTKQELAQRSGLSLPTVYQAFNALDAEGLIEAAEVRGSTGGRRAQAYTLAAGRAAAIGISLTGNQMRAVACDLFGQLMPAYERQIAMPASGNDAGRDPVEALSIQLGTMATELTDALQADGIRPLGVGIAVPSAIDPASGALVNTTVLGIQGQMCSVEDLMARIELPTLVANDAACGGFAEQWDGDASTSSLVYLSLERGVGGSIIVDGKPLNGQGGASGEFGHMCLEPGGRRCACGNRGCLEAYCSTACLSDNLGLTLDAFFARLDSGETEATAAWNDFADHLAHGIQLIHMAFDLEIVLGGMLAQYLPQHLDALMERIERLGSYGNPREYLRLTRHPHHAVPLGAAQQALQRFIDSM